MKFVAIKLPHRKKNFPFQSIIENGNLNKGWEGGPRNKQKMLDEHACAVDVLVAKVKVEQLGIAYLRKIHLNALNGTLFTTNNWN